MKRKTILVLILTAFISLASIFATKGIVGFSSSNLEEESNYYLVNRLLKQKLESTDYKYYFADSKSDESIQYYSVIDLLNKNIGTLIINPVSQENYGAIIKICKKMMLMLLIYILLLKVITIELQRSPTISRKPQGI
jgi:ABC-type xylose transport system substrate-binding protein